MNRLLQIVNFLGVLILAGLCAMQWRDNGRWHAQVEDLEMTRQEQSKKIAEQEKTIQGYAADLDDLRGKLAKSDADSKETRAKLDAAEADAKRLTSARDQLAAERDQDKAAIEKWSVAVAQRDDLIKSLNAQVQKLATERDEATAKYNGVVTQLNARTQSGH